jgi:hypothetical protein
MILYVNGDSHSAGAEAVNPACFIVDNWKYNYNNDVKNSFEFWKDEINWAPYPDNLNVSYGQILANRLGAQLHCHARSAGSNDRIIRTTYEYLNDHIPDFILIGWSTWEREEWYNDEDREWYQVNGSGIDSVPEKWTNRYKKYVTEIDWNTKLEEAHEKIWNFHQDLKNKSIPHLFFNCHLTFYDLLKNNKDCYKDWGPNYIFPYSETFSYGKYLIQAGINPNKWYHFGPDGHLKWADYLLPHLTALL